MGKNRMSILRAVFICMLYIAYAYADGDLAYGLNKNQFPWAETASTNIFTNLSLYTIKLDNCSPTFLSLNARVIRRDIVMLDTTRMKRYSALRTKENRKFEVVFERFWVITSSFSNVLTAAISNGKIGVAFHDGYHNTMFVNWSDMDCNVLNKIKELKDSIQKYKWFPSGEINNRYKHLYVIFYDTVTEQHAYCFSWCKEFLYPYDSHGRNRPKFYIPAESRKSYLLITEIMQMIREHILKAVQGDGCNCLRVL